MSPITIEYRIHTPYGEERFPLQLDPHTLAPLETPPEQPPAWTRLSFCQCSNCPLSAPAHSDCPLALQLVKIVQRFDRVMSHDPVQLEVITRERTLIQQTTAQRAISALMGLLMATSGCPHTRYFKPMARFHLPLASDAETLYRTTTMYMLAQYFRHRKGEPADLEFTGLRVIYANVQQINVAISERLRQACRTDASINAVIMLDLYAKALPYAIDEALEELAELFAPFVDNQESGGLDRSE